LPPGVGKLRVALRAFKSLSQLGQRYAPVCQNDCERVAGRIVFRVAQLRRTVQPWLHHFGGQFAIREIPLQDAAGGLSGSDDTVHRRCDRGGINREIIIVIEDSGWKSAHIDEPALQLPDVDIAKCDFAVHRHRSRKTCRVALIEEVVLHPHQRRRIALHAHPQADDEHAV